MTLKRLLTAKLRSSLRRRTGGRDAGNEEPPWMAGFGALSDLSEENRRILSLIEDEFESLPPEDAAR